MPDIYAIQMSQDGATTRLLIFSRVDHPHSQNRFGVRIAYIEVSFQIRMNIIGVINGMQVYSMKMGIVVEEGASDEQTYRR